MFKFKGRGLLQITGKNKMSAILGSNPTTPIPAISITGIGSSVSGQYHANKVRQQVGNIQSSLFQNIFESEPHYKKYEVYEFTDDILAISCAWKRFRDINPNEYKFGKLTDKNLFDTVNHEDREQAKVIRDYYSKKLMIINLRGDNLSSFRKALSRLIQSDPSKIIEDLFPVAYRLPEFYEYDCKIDDIKLSMDDRLRGPKLEKLNRKETVFDLTPITRLKKQNRRMKVTEYWFKEQNVPVVIYIDPKNPLLHIWDNIFNSKKVLQISGTSFVKHMDDFEYLSINNWKLV